MSDDMDKKIKQIADMLGQNQNTNLPDNLKGMLNMLMSANNKSDSSQADDESKHSSEHNSEEQSSTRHHAGEDKKEKTDLNDAADLTRKMKKAMDMINTSNDPRMNLLNALRPYLNSERQIKLQKAVKLIRLGGLTKLLDDSEERSI